MAPDEASSGGQVVAHDPVHATFIPFSGVNKYSVRPSWFTRTVPTTGAVPLEIEEAIVALPPPFPDVDVPELVLELLLEQAASSRSTAIAAAITPVRLAWICFISISFASPAPRTAHAGSRTSPRVYEQHNPRD
jgi:hypothetical protein